MKSIIIILLVSTANVFSQTVLFSDDFESGLAGWTLTGEWGLTSDYSYNGNSS